MLVRRCVYIYQAAARFCVKWRHGRHLEITTSNRKFDSVDQCVFRGYLLYAWSYQISPWSDLKRRSLWLFAEVAPTRRRTTRWVEIWNQQRCSTWYLYLYLYLWLGYLQHLWRSVPGLKINKQKQHEGGCSSACTGLSVVSCGLYNVDEWFDWHNHSLAVLWVVTFSSASAFIAVPN